MTMRIGAQLYTVRDFCKTAGDLARTCQRIAAMGYEGVQVSAIGPIEPKEVRRILDDHGLVCAATHKSLDALRDTAKVIEEHQILGCSLTALGAFHGPDEAAWRQFAQTFNQIGKTLAAQGLRVGYHNHSHELAPLGEPRLGVLTPLRLLLDELDPSIWFEIDTYWITHGGGDPAMWIEACRGRIPSVHFKDMTITPERQQKMCEVGSGNLNWPRIFQACRDVGVQWCLVERDHGDLDPFQSLEVSLRNLQEMGLN